MDQHSRQYAEVPHSGINNTSPATREVHGMERIPIFPPRQVTGGLRLPIVRVEQYEEVFNEKFYDIFPWAREIDPFDESRTEWEPAEWHIENQIPLGNGLEPDQNAELPPAIAFVNGLISLELDDLRKGDKTCAICLQPYREGEFQEIPLQLPCGHTFGKDCLLSWLWDIGNDGAHVACCPICRRECISEKRKHIGTFEGLKQLLRDTNYLLTGMKGLTLTQEGKDEWEDVKVYVNAYIAGIEEAKRQRLQCFMINLRKNLGDFPLTVVPATVKAIGRDVVELRKTTSQLLNELEQRGVIAEYLDAADGDSDEDEMAGRTVKLADIIPGPLLNYMDEIYAEQTYLEPNDEVLSPADTEGEEISDNEETIDAAEDDGIEIADRTEGAISHHGTVTDAALEDSGVTGPGRDDLTSTLEIFSDQINTSASRPRRNSWIGHHETQHWTWLCSDDSDMENVQMDFDNEDLPAGNDDERALRLLGQRVQETYDAVMHHRTPRRTR